MLLNTMKLYAMDRKIELVILEDAGNDKLNGFLDKNIGSIYIQVTPETLSEVRSTLIDNKFTTRLLVIVLDQLVKYYVYGKKKKRIAVYNQNCKNTVIRNDKYIDILIKASSNTNDIVYTDNPLIKMTVVKLKRLLE